MEIERQFEQEEMDEEKNARREAPGIAGKGGGIQVAVAVEI